VQKKIIFEKITKVKKNAELQADYKIR
jgi:hypothetical protein